MCCCSPPMLPKDSLTHPQCVPSPLFSVPTHLSPCSAEGFVASEQLPLTCGSVGRPPLAPLLHGGVMIGCDLDGLLCTVSPPPSGVHVRAPPVFARCASILKAGDFAREVVDASPMLGAGGAVGGFRRCAILGGALWVLPGLKTAGVFFFLLHLTLWARWRLLLLPAPQCNRKTRSLTQVPAHCFFNCLCVCV